MQADCIVSNPPYLTVEEWENAAPEVREHEPREALVASGAGAADLLQIIESAFERLAPEGLLALEMGIHHGGVLTQAAAERGYLNVIVEPDDSGRDRFLFAKKK